MEAIWEFSDIWVFHVKTQAAQTVYDRQQYHNFYECLEIHHKRNCAIYFHQIFLLPALVEVNKVERGRTYLFKCKNCCHLLSTNKGQDLAQTSCLPHFGKKGQKKLQKDAEKFKGVSAQLQQCKKLSLTASWCDSVAHKSLMAPLIGHSFCPGLSLTENQTHCKIKLDILMWSLPIRESVYSFQNCQRSEDL